MRVDDKLLDQLCELARLSIEGEERAALLADLARVLDFVEKINELPLEGVEPLLFVGEPSGYLREDEPVAPAELEPYARNAPQHDGLYWRVPKFGVKEV